MRRSLLALLLAAGLSTAGCGAADTVLERVRPDSQPVTRVATIGVLAPLSGGQTRTGASIVAAIEQAVDDSGGIPGWDIRVTAIDLAETESETAVEDMAEDDTAVAVITGFSAEEVRQVVPPLDDAGLTVLSPADADPRHLRGADPQQPLRPWGGYVSVAVDPAPEQAALAGHLTRAVGVNRAAVITDGSAEAQTRSQHLVAALEQRGMTDVVVAGWDGGAAEGPVADALATLGSTDAVVIDAPVDLAATIAATRPAGTVVALMTHPGELAGQVAADLNGALAAEPGADPGRGSDELAAALQAGGRTSTVAAVAPAAYDGTRLLMDALGRCLPDPLRSTSPSRSACRAEVAGAEWTGLTGAIRFDEFGARLGVLPSVVALRDGVWGIPGA